MALVLLDVIVGSGSARRASSKLQSVYRLRKHSQ